MRNILILLILLVSNVSGFAFYGYGENIEDNKSNPFFITEANDFFSLNESSSMWSDTFSNLSLQYDYTSSRIVNTDISNSYLSNINYTFPFDKTTYLAFGYNPSTISKIRLFADNFSFIGSNELSTINEPIAYNILYDNDGGISKSYLSYLKKISKNFFLGIKYSRIYGNLEKDKIIYLYDLQYSESDQNNLNVNYILNDSIFINSVNEFSGSSIQLETNLKSKSYDLIFAATYYFPLKIKNRFFFDENIVDIQNLEQLQTYFQPNQIINYRDSEGLKDVCLGLRFKFDEVKSWLFRYNHSQSYDYNISMLAPDFEINSLTLSFKYAKSSLSESILNKSVMKLSLHYKNLNNNDIDEIDYGLSLNYGLRLYDKNYFSIFIKAGQKTNKYLDLGNESYQILGFKMDNFEKWFLKGD